MNAQPTSETILALMDEIQKVLTENRHLEPTAHACFRIVALAVEKVERDRLAADLALLRSPSAAVPTKR